MAFDVQHNAHDSIQLLLNCVTFLFSDGKVQFLKAYAGHNVVYEGEAKGMQMTGHWWLEDAPDVKGDWAMWPATA